MIYSNKNCSFVVLNFIVKLNGIKMKPDVTIKPVEAKSTLNHPIRVSNLYKMATKLCLEELDGISDPFVFSKENTEPLMQIATKTSYPNTSNFESRDKSLIIWSLNRDESSFGYTKRALKGHNGFVNDVVMSSDEQTMLWDLSEKRHSYTLKGEDVINALSFSLNRDWLCTATGSPIKI